MAAALQACAHIVADDACAVVAAEAAALEEQRGAAAPTPQSGAGGPPMLSAATPGCGGPGWVPPSPSLWQSPAWAGAGSGAGTGVRAGAGAPSATPLASWGGGAAPPSGYGRAPGALQGTAGSSGLGGRGLAGAALSGAAPPSNAAAWGGTALPSAAPALADASTLIAYAQVVQAAPVVTAALRTWAAHTRPETASLRLVLGRAGASAGGGGGHAPAPFVPGVAPEFMEDWKRALSKAATPGGRWSTVTQCHEVLQYHFRPAPPHDVDMVQESFPWPAPPGGGAGVGSGAGLSSLLSRPALLSEDTLLMSLAACEPRGGHDYDVQVQVVAQPPCDAPPRVQPHHVARVHRKTWASGTQDQLRVHFDRVWRGGCVEDVDAAFKASEHVPPQHVLWLEYTAVPVEGAPQSHFDDLAVYIVQRLALLLGSRRFQLLPAPAPCSLSPPAL